MAWWRGGCRARREPPGHRGPVPEAGPRDPDAVAQAAGTRLAPRCARTRSGCGPRPPGHRTGRRGGRADGTAPAAGPRQAAGPRCAAGPSGTTRPGQRGCPGARPRTCPGRGPDGRSRSRPSVRDRRTPPPGTPLPAALPLPGRRPLPAGSCLPRPATPAPSAAGLGRRVRAVLPVPGDRQGGLRSGARRPPAAARQPAGPCGGRGHVRRRTSPVPLPVPRAGNGCGPAGPVISLTETLKQYGMCGLIVRLRSGRETGET